jgi:hypothetical protein
MDLNLFYDLLMLKIKILMANMFDLLIDMLHYLIQNYLYPLASFTSLCVINLCFLLIVLHLLLISNSLFSKYLCI